MNEKLFFGVMSLLFVLTFVSAGESEAGVEIMVDFVPQEVGIMVDNSIELPTVTNGYVSEESISVSNIGNVDILLDQRLVNVNYFRGNESINPELYNPIFNELQVDIDGDFYKVGNHTPIIQKPLNIGGTTFSTAVLMLDLRGYTIPIDTADNEVALIFTAIPAI
jgi:hypothetical protein